MARRKVKAEESLVQRAGDAPPKPGTYIARRAKAALRAIESKQRLTPEETREAMRFLPEHIAVLDAIAAGLPVRGAREAVAAMRLRAEFLLSKPAAAVDARVGIVVVSPYDNDAPAEGQAPAPAPALAPLVFAALPAVAGLPDGQVSGEDEDDA
jgi:hypothetical protein